MINKPSDLFGNPDWSELQAQYLEALNSFSTTFSGKPKQASIQEQWIKAMDFWWQSNKGAVPSEQRSFFDHMMNQGKSMYYLADQFSQIMDAVSSMKETSDEWLKTVDEQINSMKAGFESGGDFGAKAFQDIMGAFSMPNDVLAQFANVPPGFAQALGANAMGANFDNLNFGDPRFDELFEKYLSIPGVGYSRETQEKIQKNILLYKEYQKVNDEYNQAMSQVGVKALDMLRNKIVEHAKGENKLESLKEIYNLWVDCNEEAYAEYVFGKEYSELNGRLINSLMAFKKHNSELMEELFAGFNIPSKRQIDDLLVSQQSLRHKLKQSEQEKNNTLSRLEVLERELEAMRLELNGGTADVKKPKAAPKKTKTKVSKSSNAVKKTTRKKAKKKTASKQDQDMIEIKF